MDVFNAGLGNDDIIINASNITALEQTGADNRARVDGGGGVDTLKLDGAGLTLGHCLLGYRYLRRQRIFHRYGYL
jgi:hypothetical protein